MRMMIFDIVVIGGLSLLFYVLDIRICPFYNLLHFQCPACGMTRAFISFMKGDVLSCIKHNLLFIPIFILVLVYLFLWLHGNKDQVDYWLNKNQIYLFVVCFIIIVFYTIVRNS